jgi:DNA-binding MarR family transcriptional regulator
MDPACHPVGHVQSVNVSVTSGSTSAASGQVTGPPTAAVELVELLDQVDRAVDATVLPATSAEGVSREGWRVLLLLARGGGRSMGEVAERTGVPAPTATRVVNRLVSDGLAQRFTDPDDRRRVLVQLAPQGGQVVARITHRLSASRRDELRELLVALVDAVA